VTLPSVIVVGGGTIGLAAAWALTRRGADVTVVERYSHVHEHGSHGGYTRAIRHAYHEGESYVPLVREADAAWVELGRRRDEELLVRSGLLEFGAADDPEYGHAIEACQIHEIDHDLLDAREAMSRWPFQIPEDWGACFTPSGGYLRVVPCLGALRDEASEAGASFRYGARVVELDGTRVRLDDGTWLSADRIVIAMGAGLPALLGDSLPPLRCLRRALLWTRPSQPGPEVLRTLPVWGAFVPEGFFYGFPWNDDGIPGLKIACHRTRGPDVETAIDPETVERRLLDSDVDPVRQFAKTYFPAADADIVEHRVCLYTATGSWDFVVDHLPGDDRVLVAGGFSGHGFKFAPAIGRVLADMALDDADGPPQFALSRSP
jgi:monomeric sarcosine oxidase